MHRKIKIFITLCLTALIAIGAPPKRTSQRVKEEKNAAAKEIKATTKKIDANAKETERQINQLNLLKAEISETDAHIKTIGLSVDSLNRQIAAINGQIATLESNVKRLQNNYAAALKRMQGRRQSVNAFAFIFSSESFDQAYRRMRYLRQFSKWRERKTRDIELAQKQLKEKRDKLANAQEQRTQSLNELTVAQATLQTKQAATDKIVADLKAEGGALRQYLSKKEQEARKLDAELDRIIALEIQKREQELAEKRRKEAERQARLAEERRRKEEAERVERERIAREQALAKAQKEKEEAERQKAEEAKRKKEEADKDNKDKGRNKPVAKPKPKDDKAKQQANKDKQNKPELPKQQEQPKPAQPKPVQPTKPAVEDNDIKLSGDFASNRGKLPFPVSGSYKIVKHFGRQRHPELHNIETENSGIDIEVSPGGKARAIFPGVVSAIFRQPGFNTIVMVRHGNYLTIYAGLSSIFVKTGDKVSANQSIGTVYSDPDDNGRSILHFELRLEKQKLNPEEWVRR